MLNPVQGGSCKKAAEYVMSQGYRNTILSAYNEAKLKHVQALKEDGSARAYCNCFVDEDLYLHEDLSLQYVKERLQQLRSIEDLSCSGMEAERAS
jgi:hypothetical protein